MHPVRSPPSPSTPPSSAPSSGSTDSVPRPSRPGPVGPAGGPHPLVLDGAGRIRLDGWELDDQVQDRVRQPWAAPEMAVDDPFQAAVGSD
ncbi:hypothetical protein [Streptomyces sp. NPDC088762]|uniref:hypothetical protein n=1 Tax=Streptomyces sp. NPDC088762 TaxID=3365891 RepID=UPI00382F5CF4